VVAPRAVLAGLAAGLLAGCGPSGRPSTTSPSHHTAAVTSTTTASPSSTAPTAAAATGWTTYQHDGQRSGVADPQPAITTLRRAWRTVLDGQVYAEPLVSGSQVIVATEANTVYSLDQATGAVGWSTHLGAAVPGDQLPCGNISPSGITGTPVIDPPAGRVWVVAFVEPGAHQLLSLNLATGAVESRQTIALPGVDALAEQQRGALTLSAGWVYVPFGGLFGDCGNYRGFLAGVPTTGSTQRTFAVPTTREGAIWAPGGAVADASGSLFVAVGNSASRTRFDDGNSVLRLTPALRVADSFAPRNWAALNGADLDLGSVSPAIVGPEVFQVGKQGVGYLLARDRLGGVGGQLFSAPVCGAGAFGATAVDGSTVLVPCDDGLNALVVRGSTFAKRWTDAIGPGPPVVAGGAVLDVTLDGQLVVLNEQTGRQLQHVAVGKGATSYPSLAVAGGRAIVTAGSAVVAVSGI
jgi:outer membrane protein assembly factor BamB